MRPIRLIVSAFGPFADTQSIQFSDFSQNALFLINGPTGAGKTTILDGICFALYGRTTGNEREGSQMRCDLADEAILTQVTFEFSLGEYQYRISRVPEQARKKSRGDGYTQQKPEAQLFRIDSDGNETLLVETKVSEATTYIEDILGLDVDQFRQVMVLPQGKFRDLLMADSKSREKIFGQLFQTQIYRRIEDKLRQQSSEVRQQVQAQRNKREGILQSVSLSSDDELSASLSELNPLLENAGQVKSDEHTQLLQLTQTLQQDKLLKQQFTDLENQKRIQQSLEQNKSVIDAKVSQISQAKLAAEVMPLYVSKQQRSIEFEQSKIEGEQAQKALENSKQIHAKASADLSKLEHLELEQKSFEQHLVVLNELAPILAEKSQVSVSLVGAEKELESTEQQLTESERRLQTLQSTKQQIQQQLPELRIQADKQHELQAQIFQLQQLNEKLTNLAHKQTETAKFNQQLLQAKEDGQSLKTIYESKVDQHTKLRLDWHQSQASVLAQQLQLNKPCPVCGSVEHPNPAVAAIIPPTEQDLEKAQLAESTALTALNEARSSYKHLKQLLLNLDAEAQSVRLELGEYASRTVAENQQQIEYVQTQLEQASKAIQQVNQLQNDYQRIEQQETQLNTERQSIRKRFDELTPHTVTLRSQLAEIEKRLSNDVTDLNSLNAKQQELRNEAEFCAKQISQIREAHNRSSQTVAANEASLVSASKQERIATENRDSTIEAFSASLISVGFTDEKALLSANLDKPVLQSLEAEAQQYQQQCSVNQSKLDELKVLLAEKHAPDIEALEQQQLLQQQSYQKAEQAWQELQTQVTQLQQVKQQLVELDKATKTLEDEYAVIGTLSDVANGQTGNRISLNRFVLSVLLDDVLLDASRRLHMMSKGRYRLLRKEDKAKGNKASGLELEVEDAYTSKVRDVATLSGGESFMAALSLALALSEVVQAYAGGIKLDTLFIDEGFGSLDQDSLELAIRTLVDLQSAGRMIGVISHVTEMKEQIQQRIDIQKTSVGSLVKLRLNGDSF
ncbi:SMC family ATPase [Shewanella sp. 202IG2-18]|uniref:AAA family ATPase n=1 Tax=Parashewanella hymeniacidonis TaxID=2807618 RepID=UPI001960A7A9|nr:SMC family ATPase [Parashewanella hymeniacidonis]MBM7071639.1 SMC family ATPase [Parashewanella hymeniacidonis]